MSKRLVDTHGAKSLASRHGSELDRVNCPFYLKVGACRHGDRSSRHHLKPVISPTLLLSNMYQRPDMITPNVLAQPVDPKNVQQHFEDFYEDLFEELSKYGEIRTLDVCDNVADHMVGNVYVQFSDEDEAANALKNLTGRFYSGRPIIVEFSPVTEFKDATCRQYEENTCVRDGYCNFMHRKRISRELRRQLFGRYTRKRSRSPDRRQSYEGRSHGSRSHSRRHDEDREYDSRSRRRVMWAGSLSRAGSEERRAVYEQWNKEKEEAERARKAGGRNGDDYHGHEPPRQTLCGH